MRFFLLKHAINSSCVYFEIQGLFLIKGYVFLKQKYNKWIKCEMMFMYILFTVYYINVMLLDAKGQLY